MKWGRRSSYQSAFAATAFLFGIVATAHSAEAADSSSGPAPAKISVVYVAASSVWFDPEDSVHQVLLRNDSSTPATVGGIYLVGSDVHFVLEDEDRRPQQSVELPPGRVTTVFFSPCTSRSEECGEKPDDEPSATQAIYAVQSGGSLEIRLIDPAKALVLLSFQLKVQAKPGFLLTMGILLALTTAAVMVLSATRAIDDAERKEVRAGRSRRAHFLVSLGPASIEKSWSVWYSAAVGVGVSAALPALTKLGGQLGIPVGVDPLVIMGVTLAIPLGFAPLVLVSQVIDPNHTNGATPPEGSYLVGLSRFLFAQFLVLSSALGETVLLVFWVGRSLPQSLLLPEFATFLGMAIVVMVVGVGIYFAYHRIMTTYRETVWRPPPAKVMPQGAGNVPLPPTIPPSRRRVSLV